MNIRRWSVGVLAATLFLPGLAACNSSEADKPSGAASPAIPADPKEALAASTKEIEKGNFSFTMAGDGLTGEGVMNKPGKSAQLTMSFDDGSGSTMALDLIHIDSDSWVKVDFGELADSIPGLAKMRDKYQHLDQSKVKDSDALSIDMEDVDPAGADALFKAITEVQETGPGAYSGKLDATRATDSGALDADLIKALGDQAKALPFVAKLDAEGRLTEVVVSVPAAGDTKAHDLKVTYADYGSAATPQKPPADKVVEASDETYEMFK